MQLSDGMYLNPERFSASIYAVAVNSKQSPTNVIDDQSFPFTGIQVSPRLQRDGC